MTFVKYVPYKDNERIKPRTIRIGNYDVPEYCKAWVNKSILEEGFIACFNFEKEECAELMLKALQELLSQTK